MNIKTFKLFTLCLFAVLLCSFAPQLKAHASDMVLVEWVVVTDDWVETSQAFQCGKAVDTSIACQDELRACKAGIDEIMDNAYRVCGKRPQDCSFIDVTATEFTRPAYNFLVGDPIDFYANGAEVASVKNCRVQHPKSEDTAPKPVSTQAEADAALQEKLAKERGQLPAPVVVNADAPQVPANPPVVAAEQVSEINGGGCSMQISKSPMTALQGLIAALLMLIAFTATMGRRSYGFKKTSR